MVMFPWKGSVEIRGVAMIAVFAFDRETRDLIAEYIQCFAITNRHVYQSLDVIVIVTV
jgi:hypothetical protein